MPDILSQSNPPASTLLDYLPIATAFITLILIPLLRRRASIMDFVRALLEAASQRQKAAEPPANGNGNGNGNGSYLLTTRIAATLAESQGARIETVEETQRNNVRRLEAMEIWKNNLLPELESVAKIGAYNAFSGKVNEIVQRMTTMENRQELMQVDIDRINQIDARLDLINAEIQRLKDKAA